MVSSSVSALESAFEFVPCAAVEGVTPSSVVMSILSVAISDSPVVVSMTSSSVVVDSSALVTVVSVS